MAPTKKFVPRQRKHKTIARQAREKANETGERTPKADPSDSNATEIIPESKREREERKAKLREELRAGQPAMSSKKAKRFEKYMETKLRKDENREIYERLAAKAIDTTQFESFKNLGQGKKRRRIEAQKAKDANKAGDASSDEEEDENVDESESEQESTPAPTQKQQNGKSRPFVPSALFSSSSSLFAAPKTTSQTTSSDISATAQTSGGAQSNTSTLPSAIAGSGLKRPLEIGDDGRPIIQKRQKRGGVKSKYAMEQVHEDSDSYDEWGGFSDDLDNSDSDDAKSGEGGSEEGEEEESASDESGDDNSSSDSGDSSDEEEESGKSAFKIWAEQSRNESLGFQPSAAESTILEIPRPENFTPRAIEEDPLPIELQPTKNIDRKVYNVTVTRTPEIEETRLALPIAAEEQQIMEAIHENDVVVISGGTGSGKTTQVPQFLYEAGYGSPDSPTPGMIGITQPRRVAAVSMSRRVTEELGDHGHVVGYQIRFERRTTQKTAIKFMTDGVLLKEQMGDLYLSDYSVIIVDEAHERSINTDVLVGCLSLVNRLRKDKGMTPLKLIIMSATLQIEDLTNNKRLFPLPPRVISVDGRQFPVTVHFAQRTHHDFVEEAFKKICRGHRKLPAGGFLVFLTGEDEIQRLAKRLRLEINGYNSSSGPKVRIPSSEVPYEPEDVELGGDVEVDDYIEDGNDGEDGSEDGIDENDDAEFVIEEEEGETVPAPLKMHVLPLFSKLPTSEQQRVFRPAPDGHRQVILATNVAETSLTIPGIRFVFDCGRSKERKYNQGSGVQSFEVGWISKASASQRSGRAGRTGPGHCYRLFSSAVFEENFEDFAEPEILRMPIEGVVLQLKSMNIPKVDLFPFPTPPDRQSLARSEKLLQYIGAVDQNGKITDLGQRMAPFPLAPRFARILLLGHAENCIHYVIAMVAAMSVEEIFVRPNTAIPAGAPEGEGIIRTQEHIKKDEERKRVTEEFKKAHRYFCNLDSGVPVQTDIMKLLMTVCTFSFDSTEEWCKSHFVHFKALREVQQIRRQITELLREHQPGTFGGLEYKPELQPPTERQVAFMKQMAAAGFIDNVAIRADKAPSPPEMPGRKPTRAIDVPYIPLKSHAKDTDFIYLHPSSPMSHLTPGECPTYVVYRNLHKGSRSTGGKEPKTRMHTITDISGSKLTNLAKDTPLLSWGKPIKVNLSADGTERDSWMVPNLRWEDAAGGLGWPLPLAKIKQRKVPGRGWQTAYS